MIRMQKPAILAGAEGTVHRGGKRKEREFLKGMGR
jgi:hypothetical protein